MGKIQAVICPQCGSVDLKPLGDDKFQCGNCRATYFIDKEKVEVHVKHSFDSPKPAGEPISSSSLKKIFGIIFVVFASLFAVTLGLNALIPKKAVSDAGFSVAANIDERAKYIKIALSDSQPKLFVLSEKIERDKKNYEMSDSKILLKMYEPTTKKFEKEIEIVASTKQAGVRRGFDSESQISVLGNMIWCVTGKSQIYGIDPDSFEIKHTNQSVTAQFGELASGIGSVEKISYEKGFKIQNNNGKSYFYFPLENKLYTETDYNKAKDGRADKNLVKRFTFQKTSRLSTVEDMKNLYQIQRLESETGPGQRCVECAYFEIEDFRAGKALSSNSVVREIKELTPERSYFNGQYLYNNADELLISYKRVANKNDAPVIQCLDADGNTKWTVETKSFGSQKNIDFSQYTSEVFKANDIYYLSENFYATAINKDGKVLWFHNILDRDNWK